LGFGVIQSVSGLILLKVHGHPSIGASGVIYAIDGFLVRLVDFDWRLVCVDYVLFHLATIEDGIDHVAHAGGFLFGYLIHDIVLYQKHLFYKDLLVLFKMSGYSENGIIRCSILSPNQSIVRCFKIYINTWCVCHLHSNKLKNVSGLSSRD
jgi:hypothetical protein